MRDLTEVRAAYERGEGTLHELAGKFQVPLSTLKKRAAKEKWHAEKTSACLVPPATGTFGARSTPPSGTIGTSPTSAVGTSGSATDTAPSQPGTCGTPAPDANGTIGTHAADGDGTLELAAVRDQEDLEPTSSSAPAIPANINLWSRREAALFYFRHLGWAIHHLHAFDQGTEKQKGKKPFLPDWPRRTAAHVKRSYIDSHFGGDSQFNLGVVVRPPFVAVDLDSKEDNGESVRAWLASQPELAAVPRERTGGGAHLHFRCPDLPETVLTHGKAIATKLSETVMAELYSNGLNLVLSPSIHKTGHVYTWEVTGQIPEVRWIDLVRWFEFVAPAHKKRGGRWDPAKWWLAYEGDLRTLDMPGLCGELGWLGDCLDPDSGKWAVICPWAAEHSDHCPNASATPASDTAIFDAVPGGNRPGFKCLHAHCAERTIEHFLAEAEKVAPGIVNRRCASRRERGRVKMEPPKLPVWLVPDGSVKLATESIRELGDLIAPSHSMFVMNAEVVRLLDHRRQPYCTKRKDDETRHDFAVQILTPVQLITAIESFCRPAVLRTNSDGEIQAIGTVLKRAQAEFTIASSQFSDAIPQLKRVLRSPVPSAGDRPGELLFPEPGFNPATGMFLSLDAVHALPLPPTPGNIAWAKAALAHLLAFGTGDSFAFATPQDECHSFARFLTPFCRGLMDWCKGPVWTFEADDPGTGKDTLADLTHVQQTGAEIGFSPTTDVEEMRKAITSFLLAGGSFFHIGNIRGPFKCAPFEAATAASRTHQDRFLGENKTLKLRNEAEYSFSANDATFTPDILRRCRRIFQRWKGESVNNRVFRIRGIIGWTFRNRPLLATAALTLIQAYWRERGSASSRCEFSSFPEWADIVGGLCLWAGFGNPTKDHLLDASRRDIGAPDAAEDRDFLKLLHEHTSGGWTKHNDVLVFAEQNGKEALPSVNWDRESSWRRQMGRKLAKLVDKERGPYVLQRRGKLSHQSRLEYRVVIRDGHSPDEEALVSSTFTGDWFQAPAAPCLDQAGNLALPGAASRLSPCTNSNDGCTPAPVPPVWPVFEGRSGSPLRIKLIEEKSGDQSCDISCGGIYDPPWHAKIGQTGAFTPASLIQGGAKAEELPERHLCSSRADLERVIDDLTLSTTDRIALDIETHGPRKGDGLDPWRGDIRLLTLRREGGPVWTLDLMPLGYDLGALGEMLREATVIAHNARFDCLWLRVKCGLRLPKVICTLTAARLLAAGTKPGNNLDQCLQRYLGIAPGQDQSRSDWGAMFLTDDQLAYAARDVAHLHDLAGVLEAEIGKAGLESVWALESDLLPRVVEMEAAGIRVDADKLRTIAAKANADATQASAALREALGKPSLNPASQPQLIAALRAAGLELDSTAEAALKEADDGRIVPLVLAHREAIKRAQQAESLLAHVQADGRIHARFEPTGTATGRFSSKEPNLQNIGRGELREAFVPEPGHKFVVADYSQVELRAAAAIAGETKMIEAYRAGADLHKLTASIVLGKPEAEIRKEDRQTAKSCNFGLIYGQTPNGLVRYAAASYGVHLEPEQALEIRKAFFRTYGHLRQWHGLSHQKAERGVTEVRTRLGRRRLIPETASDWERFTALVNTPVQGGCADGMKRAIVLVAERLPEGARILSTVHDELIVEALESQAEEVGKLVEATMREAMEALFPEVPIEVDTGTCNHWGEKG